MIASRGRRASVISGHVIVAAAIALLGACGVLPKPATHGSAGNYIRINGIIYLAQLSAEVVGLGHVVQAADLGAEFARIPKDEFPSLLSPGTPVFTVQGYLPHVRLAASHEGELILFEAWGNSAARHGSDVLDLSGKVSSIGILDDQSDGPRYVEVGAITGQTQVALLVEMVLQAPVDHDVANRADRGEATYWIAWHLIDGTVVVRPYWSKTNELFDSIKLPPEFGAAIKQAIATD